MGSHFNSSSDGYSCSGRYIAVTCEPPEEQSRQFSRRLSGLGLDDGAGLGFGLDEPDATRESVDDESDDTEPSERGSLLSDGPRTRWKAATCCLVGGILFNLLILLCVWGGGLCNS